MQVSPETILEMPAVLFVGEVESRLADEQNCRHFYQIIEGKTLEFIDGNFVIQSASVGFNKNSSQINL